MCLSPESDMDWLYVYYVWMYALPQKKMQRWVMNDKNLRHGYQSNDQYQKERTPNSVCSNACWAWIPQARGSIVGALQALDLCTWA